MSLQAFEQPHDNQAHAEKTDAAPSLKRASLLFVASLGTLIGTSLFLASIGHN